jgi:GTP-binding protein YchF
MLADLDSLERRIAPLEKRAKGGEKEARAQVALMEKALVLLREGRPAREAVLEEAERKPFKMLQLLTAKPMLFVCNVDEDSAADGNEMSAAVAARAARIGAACVVISAAIEAEVASLDSDAERQEFLESLGLAETGLARVIRAGYGLLDLITFFTVGPKEARAWTVRHGAKAPECAGVIHTDFEKGFIRAETISYADFTSNGGEQGAKDAGRMRLEGKDYVARDGDVFHFRFNV